MPVTLIPGDGVGPEIMDSTKEVLNRMGAKVHICDVGFPNISYSWLKAVFFLFVKMGGNAV